MLEHFITKIDLISSIIKYSTILIIYRIFSGDNLLDLEWIKIILNIIISLILFYSINLTKYLNIKNDLLNDILNDIIKYSIILFSLKSFNYKMYFLFLFSFVIISVITNVFNTKIIIRNDIYKYVFNDIIKITLFYLFVLYFKINLVQLNNKKYLYIILGSLIYNFIINRISNTFILKI